MPPGYYFLVLSCLFATSLARKSENEWENNEWAHSNTMSKEPGERHDAVRFGDTIDIDGESQGWSIDSQMADWPGSGAGHVNDDWGSGWTDDEDDGEYDNFSGYPEYKQPAVRPKPGGGLPEDKVVHPNTEQPGGPKMVDPNKDIGYEPPKEEETNIDIEVPGEEEEEEPVDDKTDKDPPAGTNDDLKHSPIIGTPGLLPGIIGGAVVGLLCAVLLVMFIVYRMRKKDEGSYALEEPKMTSPSRGYTRAPTKEYWA